MSTIRVFRINKLHFNPPLSVTVERDEDEFIAQTPEFPRLYGSGDTDTEAIDMLLEDIGNLYNELQADDNFSPEFLTMKEKFTKLIKPHPELE
jgi:predicted RNase H-like HicB family nuclease